MLMASHPDLLHLLRQAVSSVPGPLPAPSHIPESPVLVTCGSFAKSCQEPLRLYKTVEIPRTQHSRLGAKDRQGSRVGD